MNCPGCQKHCGSMSVMTSWNSHCKNDSCKVVSFAGIFKEYRWGPPMYYEDNVEMTSVTYQNKVYGRNFHIIHYLNADIALIMTGSKKWWHGQKKILEMPWTEYSSMKKKTLRELIKTAETFK